MFKSPNTDFFLFLSFIAFNNCDYICIACYLNGNYIYSSTGVKQDISRELTVRSLNSKKFWGLSMFIEIEDYKTDRDQKRRSNDQSSLDARDVLLI